MSTAIAFLSGKGGSGKTTLALSIADLSSRIGVRTLLVDCDLSTNGATYFYESQLIEQSKDGRAAFLSFDNLLNWGHSIYDQSPLNIHSKLDFIPSVLVNSVPNSEESKPFRPYSPDEQLRKFFAWAQENYEVILFDCQAGYSDFLPILLPLMSADLFVLEADSISAAAMRNLHLKIGNSFGSARLYQVFNKATPEEFDIYSKIVGTFFTNIGTLLFDWKIRQAFSRSQIPEFGYTSAKYSLDLCGICKIMLPDKAIQEKLDSFSTHLRRQQLEAEYDEVEDQLDSHASTRPLKTVLSTMAAMASFTVILLGMFLLREDITSKSSVHTQVIYILIMGIASGMLGVAIGYLLVSFLDRNDKRKLYLRRLGEIQKELDRLPKSGKT